jgi:hypothetical protein
MLLHLLLLRYIVSCPFLLLLAHMLVQVWMLL